MRTTMGRPVILDTDIGFDVDDVWALAFMLRCPELDVRLITTNTGDTLYSAKLVGRLLEIAGRTDIPIGVGVPIDAIEKTHAAWLGTYDFDEYEGVVIEDGVGAIIDVIEASDEPVAIISIGPLTNIAAMLARQPSVTRHSSFIGMQGSIRKGYLGASEPMREYNVMKHTASCQKVFATPWDISLTPLDTCGVVSLVDKNFQLVKSSQDPLASAVMENHFGWFDAIKSWKGMDRYDPQVESSILYDTVTVYMAFSEDLLEVETLPIAVTDEGRTIIDESAQKIRCAMRWQDQAAFEQLVAERLAR
ncbi:MAG: nucleoside hydrolase [Candidatus Azotimanducaceae bacterium]|nr:nucleoside hydrolase [Pseudomonadales bacterium]